MLLIELIIKRTLCCRTRNQSKKKCNISKRHQIISSYKCFWKLQRDWLSATQYRQKYL